MLIYPSFGAIIIQHTAEAFKIILNIYENKLHWDVIVSIIISHSF